MEKLEITEILKQYINWVNNNEIDFLKNNRKLQTEIIDLIKKLKDHVEKAEGDGSRFRNLNWYKVHEDAKELWKKLASGALNNIDKGSKGNNKLYDFLNKATEFEDLLYGLDDYYRDHTLHSLWVYFIGEYLLRKFLPGLHDNLNWYLYNDIDLYKIEYSYPQELVDYARNKEKELNDKVKEYRDAIWCIMALCHDLGYSLAQLKNLNKKVIAVVDFFDIPNISRTGYSLEVEHQHLIQQFLELMAMDVRIVPSENYLEESVEAKERVLTKCFRDDSTYWRLCRALEKKQHGILSSYLIYKILGIFADTSVRGAAEVWGLEDIEATDNIMRGDILFAIAQHEFDFAHLDELNSLADILVLADELEEFSRYSQRQLLSREYHDTMAYSWISFSEREATRTVKWKAKKKVQEKDKDKVQTKIISEKKEETITEKYIEIKIQYQISRHGDLREFFVRKAGNLCKLYSLGQEEEKIRKPDFYKIEGIKMIAVKGKDKFTLNFSNNPERHKAEIKGLMYENKVLTLKCLDDKLIDTSSGKSLSEVIHKRKK